MMIAHRVKNLLPAQLSLPIIKNFLIYSFGSLALRGISILSAPITMSILSPRDYGLLALINSFISISAILFGLGLRQALMLEFFHCSPTQRVSMVADMIIIYLSCSIPAIGFLLWQNNEVNSYFFASDATPKLIAVSLIIVFIYFFVELVYQLLQYLGRAKELTMLQLICGGTTLFCNITLLYLFHLGVYSIMIGQLLGMALVCVIALTKYAALIPFTTINIKQSLRKTGSYLALGLPFIPTVLFGFILASGDRWVLAQSMSLHHVGIYSVADTFGQLFQFIILIPLSNAYLPVLMSKFAQNPHNIPAIEQENKKVMRSVMGLTFVVITCGYLATKPLLFFLLPPAYHEAVTYIWLLLIGYIFLMGSHFVSSLIQFEKKRLFLATVLCVPAILNIALNFALIPHFKIYGCVFATVIAYATNFFMMLAYNSKLCKQKLIPRITPATATAHHFYLKKHRGYKKHTQYHAAILLRAYGHNQTSNLDNRPAEKSH